MLNSMLKLGGARRIPTEISISMMACFERSGVAITIAVAIAFNVDVCSPWMAVR